MLSWTGIHSASASMVTLSPSQELLLDAAMQREALAAEWLSAAQVSARLGAQPSRANALANRLRREGHLLAVYITNPVPSYRYPTWQFHSGGQSVDHLSEILTVLRNYGPFLRESDGLLRTTGWGEVEWFLASHALLDRASPAEMLTVDPARVLCVARIEFEENI